MEILILPMVIDPRDCADEGGCIGGGLCFDVTTPDCSGQGCSYLGS